jgi:radical SAM protein with 4Fe4S-binding SPASM domain
MSIRWDGTVVPCCFDFFNTYILGDVKKKGLREIWNDSPMLKLRGSMFDGTYQSINMLCKSCVILHLEPVLGVPAGMRSAVKDAVTNLMGMRAERYLIKAAKFLRSSYSLKIDNREKI